MQLWEKLRRQIQKEETTLEEFGKRRLRSRSIPWNAKHSSFHANTLNLRPAPQMPPSGP